MELQKKVMNAVEISEFLGISESKTRQFIREKRIPYIQLDGRIVFLADSILSWLRDIQTSPQNDIALNKTRSNKESAAAISNKLWRKGVNT